MKKGIAINTIIILVIFSLTAVIIFSWLIPLLEKSRVEIPLSEGSEIVRFVRYVKCSIAACTGGCNSAETYSIVLEYDERGAPILGCNQLLIDKTCCTEYDTPAKKLCNKQCILDFTFKEQTKYTSNYWVKQLDPDTYKNNPCSSWDVGWQTDLSCIGRLSDLYPCPCERFWMGNEPYGVLFDSGATCETPGGKRFIGSLWLPNSFVTDTNPVTGTENCEDGGKDDSLKSCTFPENTVVQIWTDAHTRTGTCWDFGPIKWGQRNSPVNNCPRIVICPT